MSSENVSLIAEHPFMRNFTFAIIHSIRAKNFNYEERQVVHSDMVPSISSRVIHASLKEKIVPPQIIPAPILPSPIVQKPIVMQADNLEGYGKITPLLDDPSISMIECQGTGKPLKVLRMGRVQMTRIALSPKEIEHILENVSDEARIPLLDGVFRAAVERFSISAVISSMIGSRFVIKKGAGLGVGAERLV